MVDVLHENRKKTLFCLDQKHEYLSRYLLACKLGEEAASNDPFLSSRATILLTLANRAEIVSGFDSPNINYLILSEFNLHHALQPSENTTVIGQI